jgi:deoxyribonuclease-4
MPDRKSRYPLIGAHMSIAGGIYNAIAHGRAVDCTTIQLFTKSNNQWDAKPLEDEEVEKFHADKAEAGIDPVIAHTAYLINIASPREEIFKKSYAALIEELERCRVLGIPDLVLHPGSYLNTSEEEGVKKIVDTLNRIFDETPEIKTRIALETTAGQGSNLGYKFEQLAEMIDGIENRERISVCLDTCHIFAAGYDIRDRKNYGATFKQFDEIIGLTNLRVIHLNDSLKEFNSKRDRHAHLGLGSIGLEAFKFIMRDKRLKNIPKLLETPKEHEGRPYDKINLDILRKFYKP